MKNQKDTIYQINQSLYWDSDGDQRETYQEAKECSDDVGNIYVVRKGTRVIVKDKSELDGDLLDEFNSINGDGSNDTAIISAKHGIILMTTDKDQIDELLAPIGERKQSNDIRTIKKTK